MKRILLLILLIITGCEKNYITPLNEYKMSIVVSKSSPIEFYDFDTEVGFNEKKRFGVNNDYYYNPTLGVIKFQLFEDEAGAVVVKMYDSCTELELATLTQTLIVTNYYDVEIDISILAPQPSDPFYISIELSGTEVLRSETILFKRLSPIVNANFDTDLSGWTSFTNPSGGTDPITWNTSGGGSARLSNADGDESIILGQTMSLIRDDILELSYGTSIVGGTAGTVNEFIVHGERQTDGVWEVFKARVDEFNTEAPIVEERVLNINITKNYTKIGFSMKGDGGGLLRRYQVGYFRAVAISPHEQEHITINYRNNDTTFDGMVYDETAANSYDLIVQAQFWKESWVEEQENFEKSSGSFVRAFNQKLFKKRLELGYLPNYMHEKINRILMHDVITIDGTQYIKLDEYEHENINRYNLSKASVWLTEKNNILKNVI
jgi:hypothetical protein